MSSEKKIGERARDVVSEAVSGMGEVVNDGLDEARERFEEAASDFEDRARRTRREMRRRAGEMGDAARERYDAAVEGVRSGYHRARKEASDLADDVNAYVRENPGTAIAVAAGLGFLVGMMFRGGRRRDEI